MYFFMKNVTVEMQKRSARINKIFGGRYKGSMIDSRMPFRLEMILPKFAFDKFDNLIETQLINQSFSQVESQSIKTGLLKRHFAYEKDRSTGKPIIPVVQHPQRKSQEELWQEMFSEVS